MEGDPTYQNEMGLFLIEENEGLKEGDTITVAGVPGNEYFFNESYASSMPAIGDMLLYPTGSQVTQGYKDSTFVNTKTEKDEADPLSGLEIAWLGSSVTYGQGAAGYSMADTIAEKHAATHSYKYAISGTTLAQAQVASCLPTDTDGSHGSYIYRMKQLNKDKHYDLFIVQLSTNDATNGVPMGEISADKELESQDTSTVIGAMEYIIAYIQETWNCPVMFYTGTKYDSEQYSEMVDVLKQIADKWGIGVINLWDSEINDIDDATRAEYIKEDGIHPLKAGYEEWWTPEFEKAITDYLK